MNKWLKSIIVVVAVMGILLVVRGLLFAPSDRQLIDEAVKESVQASREGRPGGVLEYLSNSFTFNNDTGLDRREVGKFIRSGKPEVTLRNPEPVFNGDQAEIVTPVHVKFDYLAFRFDQEIPDVRIILRKESGSKWLVIPTTKWRIVSVTAPDVAANFPAN